MSERESRRVVQAIAVPCSKGGTAVITVWSDGWQTCSNVEYKRKLGMIMSATVCNTCPAREK